MTIHAYDYTIIQSYNHTIISSNFISVSTVKTEILTLPGAPEEAGYLEPDTLTNFSKFLYRVKSTTSLSGTQIAKPLLCHTSLPKSQESPRPIPHCPTTT
jgi:hypothetical protein